MPLVFNYSSVSSTSNNRSGQFVSAYFVEVPPRAVTKSLDKPNKKIVAKVTEKKSSHKNMLMTQRSIAAKQQSIQPTVIQRTTEKELVSDKSLLSEGVENIKSQIAHYIHHKLQGRLNKSRPHISRGSNKIKNITLRFVVATDGSIHSSYVLQSSGINRVDSYAEKQLLALSPIPVPTEYHGDSTFQIKLAIK